MNVEVLDCTLRDGGYCNEWCFGFENIRKITKALTEANIEMIECGFLTNRVNADPDMTKFPTLSDAAAILPAEKEGSVFVVMINYGEYEIDDLPDCDEMSVTGIRVAFHKQDFDAAMEFCREIKKKGYLLFLQPMVSLNYTDDEFLRLIHSANQLRPYAFYIVDSFGVMKRKELMRLFYLVEHNLDTGIRVGFHSHNNLQLSYSNAQRLVTMQTDRRLILDSSVYGMGRGAGNLNTELLVEYLNENAEKQYILKPLLTIIDDILNTFYQRNYWGYSLPNYLSAVHNAHPNYAIYLDDKKTLTVEAMDEIFSLMDEKKKSSYDKNYIEELYFRYMETGVVQEERRIELQNRLSGKKLLLIAPGKSSVEEREKIVAFAREKNVISVSVNFAYEELEPDFIFLSNLRRFRELNADKYKKCIATSNIPAQDVYYKAAYHTLINRVEAVTDNASLMAIRFFMAYGIQEFFLAGVDGYSHDADENYGRRNMALITKNAVLDAINVGMSEVLKLYGKTVSIRFLTSPRYVNF